MGCAGHLSGTMALTLVVLSGTSSESARLTFDSPRIVVGRGTNADLRVPDYSVSARHASFRQRGSDYLIQDEGSTNGTYVGPVKLAPQAPRVIRSGDRVRFGRIWVEAILEAVPATPNAALMAREVALGLVADALQAGKEDARPRLKLQDGNRDGGKSELVLERPDHRYVLGSASGSDLVLSQDCASRRHVEVFVRSGQVYARDLGSKQGTVLAGLPLASRTETAWPAKAEMVIGDQRILLVDPVGAALLELEQGADEVLSPDEEVPIPGEETPINARVQAPTTPSARAPRRNQTKPAGGGSERTSKLELFVGLLSLIVVGVSLFGLYWLLGGH